YEVYARWWDGAYRANDVPYTIQHAGGSTTVKVDQRTNGGSWNLLGRFEFDGRGSVTVTDAATSGKDIVADAIRLVCVGVK
ncbi:MAG: golvesin C-terminal-like domain-containing protein, partial [Anaerolineae bacterium]